MTSARPRRREERRAPLSAVFAALLVASLAPLATSASAQPPATGQLPASSASSAPPSAPAPNAATTVTQPGPLPSGAQGQILTPTVDDPLLAPPPEPPRRIESWDDALSLIRSQSPDYVTAAQSVVRAEAQKRIVLAAVLPILDLQGSYTHQFYTTAFTIDKFNLVSPPPNLWTVNVGVNWSILNPRAIYQVGTASKNIEATKLSFSNQRREIAMAIVDSMLATLAAERVAEVNRVGLRSSLERLALTEARLKYGQGTQLDVDRGLRDADSARRLIIAGDEQLLQAREALGAALGSPLAISPPAGLDLDQFEAAVARTCHINDVIDRRPDVEQARVQLDIAKRKVHEAELLFSPILSVSSNYTDNNVAVLGPTKTWDVEALINVPLYDGGARYGAMRDARAAEEQARQNLIETRLNAIVGSAQALRLVGVRQAARDVSKNQVEVSQRIDDRTRNGYANGLGNSLDLVTSAQDLRQAQIDLAILDFQVASARADAVLTNAECLY